MPRTKIFPSLFALPAVLLAVLFAGATGPSLAQEEEASEARSGPALHFTVDSIIHRGTTEFVAEALARAEELDASVVVMELSTPGGMLDQTREISTLMLNSDVPVVVYVSPTGAHAASAGFFLLMSADVAAMAPGTNTGAAHPVAGDGKDIEGDMGAKVEEDASAQMRSLAERNGRPVELAVSAVIDSRSFTADEAREEGLIDLVATDLDDLLDQLDGREIRDGETTIATAGAARQSFEMSGYQKFLSLIAHPNIAAILMSLGFLGLYFEFQNPGTLIPGVIGAISLILAFLALSVLPVNYAGILLLLLAGVLFVAEIKVTSYGFLSLAALASLVMGYVLLFKSTDPAVRVSWEVIASLTAMSALVGGILLTMVVRTHRSGVTTGAEGLLLRKGVARSDLDPAGKVFIHGELWNAIADREIASGTPIRVVAVDGMTLRVEPEA